MLNVVLPIAIAMFGIALLLNAYRLFRGPDIADRVLALDTMFINTVGLLVLVGIQIQSRVNFEIALLIALMGFMGTVATAKFLLRGDVIE